MPPLRDCDTTAKARARRDLQFREDLLRAAAQALLRGDTEGATTLADLVSATDNELAEHLEDAEDLAIVSQRLADATTSDYIPHAEIEAEIYGDTGPRSR
ncbi:MAG: hypothetical protein OXR64_05965 [Chloroflexota bacterium]|nr:hypothetical protein [Chloroflexota bacterium]MDE2919377.1 hypothetical protein [Chloroflexota bacterium]